MIRRLILPARLPLLLMGLLIAATPARAQLVVPPDAHVSGPDQPAPEPPAAPSLPTAPAQIEHGVGLGWDQHPVFWLGSLGRADLRVRFQEDARWSEAPFTGGTWFWTLRRVGVGGTLRGGFEYECTGELGLTDPWRDVYVNFRRYGSAMIQGGKFKLPFGLDQLTSESNFDFIYRSRIGDQLSPGRDVGVMIHGHVVDKRVYYQGGVFDHDGGNARTTDPARVIAGTTAAGRVTVQPFLVQKSIWSDLQLGAGFTSSNVDQGLLGLRGRTPIKSSFYAPNVLVNGAQRRLGVDLEWRPGPFSAKAEYIRATVERKGVSESGGDLSPVLTDGWYASWTWFLTGERKAGAVDGPTHPLFEGGFGAVEVGARIERLQFGSEDPTGTVTPGPRTEVVPANGERVETMGANWVLNRWMKVQFDWIHETIDDPAQGPLPAQSSFWSHVMRLQFRF